MGFPSSSINPGLLNSRFEAFEVKIHSDNEYVYFSVKLVEDEEAKL